MKRLFLFILSTFLFLLIAKESFGDLSPLKTATPPSSGQMQEMKKLEIPPPKNSSTPATKQTLPPPIKPVPLVPQHAEYLHPGIVVFLNGKWEGSDHLLNIPNNIGVYVTIVKPEKENLAITEQQLQKEVEAIFGQVNIKPLTLGSVGRAPLPAFEIEVFIYPIEKGYAACCNGRLFESVTLERFKMDSNMAFQAITWEKQSLIVGPSATFAEQLTRNVQEITAAFAERFQAYERIKNQKMSQ
jgi:hypothetical protein